MSFTFSSESICHRLKADVEKTGLVRPGACSEEMPDRLMVVIPSQVQSKLL